MLNKNKEFSLPEIEEKVLSYWKDKSVFEQSLKKNEKSKKGKYVFYEGPPTANGRPGIHHVLARAFKDIIPRYKTMRGYNVPRKAGWDTHGLPVEIQAEKELGLNSKTEIEKYGIAEFNNYCKELVWKYKEEWQGLTERMGFWLDLKDPYVTYKNEYIESLWWILSRVDKKKLLYKGHKIIPWCSRCGTPLSSHELAQGYKQVKDISIFAKFKVKNGQKIGGLKSGKKTFILSWTTTPWTLPGNVALAVGARIKYAVVENKETKERYILASELVDNILKLGQYERVGEVKGRDLLGLRYEPLFNVSELQNKKSHRVYSAEFVTTTEGTGVVHTAVMYGEDDYALGVKVGLPQVHTVDETGRFKGIVKGFGGLRVKDLQTEKKILISLNKKGFLFSKERYAHDYPHCWRCDTPLLYYAHTSWFIAMSKIKAQMQRNNAQINWTPSHLKEGRFGQWLKELRDWSISRNRYWGTPIPIWECETKRCDKKLVVGGFSDLVKHSTSTNKYYGVRHGEATHNIDDKIASGAEKGGNISRLTEKGEREAKKVGQFFKNKKIDVIFSSPYARTKATAKEIARVTGAEVKIDKRLGESNLGVLNWRGWSAYKEFISGVDKFSKAPEGGETLSDVRARVVNFAREIEKKYSKKNIVFVSHGDPLLVLDGGLRGLSNEKIIEEVPLPDTGSVRELQAPVLPYDSRGKLDVHRPYIDEIVLKCPRCKKDSMRRISDVMDVWFDSGSMPLAQVHFPFAQGGGGLPVKDEKIKSLYKKIDFPADYISEAIDQTRGWFYTLLAVSTLLDKKSAYKNVVSLGHISDKNGVKMSKSKGNIVDPWEIMNTYGADAVRWYFYTVNDPGDSKDFDSEDVAKVVRKNILILYNSFVFWSSYGSQKNISKTYKPKNILDKWILADLQVVIEKMTRMLDKYDIGGAARTLEGFVDDLSRWYIRRSRERFQEAARGKAGKEGDWEEGSYTLQLVLSGIAKLSAPFMPFFSEALYRSIDGAKASVHLEDWPKTTTAYKDKDLLADMAKVRDIATKALALRAENRLKVRQPLASLTLLDDSLSGRTDLLDVLADEVNVRRIFFDKKGDEVVLDLNLTKELKEEGMVRELARAIQGLRADAKYKMSDEIVLMIQGPDALSNLVQRYSIQLKRMVNAKELKMHKSQKIDAFKETKIGDWKMWMGVRRI